MCRSTPSTSSSAPTTTFSGPGSPNYRRADLRQAQSVDKSVFEYWTHALSYVPAKDLRFFMPAMKLHRREGHKWLSSVTPADLRKVMRLIRRDGALTIRDIDDDVLVDKQHLWASRKPSKRALQLAFYHGVLTISERNGMLKTYELMARHFGWDTPPNQPPKPASARESHRLSARPRAARAGRSSAWIRSATSMRRARRRSGD